MKSEYALLIMDMFNPFDFPEGEKLCRRALPVAKNIRELKKTLKEEDVPVIYVNDNFGQWRSSWSDVYQSCTKEGKKGKEIAEILSPEEDDYFILKPKHSGFYQTPLDILLENLHIRTLIITGIAGNICVLFTANDAHMRDYNVIVPKDCIASNEKKDDEDTLHQLSSVFGFPTPPHSEIRIKK